MPEANVSRRRFLAVTAGAAAASAVPLRATAASADQRATSLVATVTTANRKIDDTDSSSVFTPSASWLKYANMSTTTWFMGTSRSSNIAGSSFSYTNPSCTRLRWYCTRSAYRADADVFIDGVNIGTVVTYSAASAASAVVFDSGELAPGSHTIKVQVKSPNVAGRSWVECDAIEVAEVVAQTFDVDDTSPTISYGTAAGGWQAFTNVTGRANGTTHSANTANATFSYTHTNCSRIVWKASTAKNNGSADVYVDGVRAGSVSQYSSVLTNDVVVFDTGVLTAGVHQLTVVCTSTTGLWIELDRLTVTGQADAPVLTNDNDTTKIRYYGTWQTAGVMPAPDSHISNSQGSAADFSFTGSMVRWMGSRQPDGGYAEVSIDGVVDSSVNTYAATTQTGQILYEKLGLSTDRYHTIRVRVLHAKQAASSGYTVNIDGFESQGPRTPAQDMLAIANSEVKLISAKTKPYLDPSTWQAKPYAAVVPLSGVRLTGGALKTCFDNNVVYLKYSAGRTNYVTSSSFWITEYPSSNEGRMLMGAGHALRWAEDADLRAIVDSIVTANKSRQRSDGFVLKWGADGSATDDDKWMTTSTSEHANYDRAMWTRGMYAAMLAGNADAGPVLRKMYDWFNSWHANRPTPVPALVTYSLGCQGHIGSTIAYHSSVGVVDDLVTAERFYVQDWWLKELADGQPLCFSRYPLNRPHSYLVIALECYADHYRATGAQKYLDAVLGGWEMFRDSFMYAGGGTSITEASEYPPKSYLLAGANSEFDGAIFWIQFNQRLLQLFPDQEKYATEIERCVYNVALAQQGPTGNHGISYFALEQGNSKQAANVINTCCEVNGTGLYSRLPEMLYSIAADGLYVNMWEASAVDFSVAGESVTLSTATLFPNDGSVTHTVTTASPLACKIRVRVPSWATASVAISVNGSVYATGQPSSYVTVDRTWSSGDTITYVLPMGFRLTKYAGFTEIDGRNRYALEYGPILLSYTGSSSTSSGGEAQAGGLLVPRIAIDPAQLVAALQPIAGQPLHWSVNDDLSRTYEPYWQAAHALCCYPMIGT